MYLARKKKERIKQEQLSTEVESKYTSPVYKVVKFWILVAFLVFSEPLTSQSKHIWPLSVATGRVELLAITVSDSSQARFLVANRTSSDSMERGF